MIQAAYPTRGRPSKLPQGGCLRPDGYIVRTRDGHAQMEHVRIAEAALGKKLPPRAKVHHVDGNRSNNRPDNLVICPNEAYHQLLHQRQRAFDASGHYDWRRCTVCGTYDAPDRMYVRQRQAVHRECRNARDRAKYSQRLITTPTEDPTT